MAEGKGGIKDFGKRPETISMAFSILRLWDIGIFFIIRSRNFSHCCSASPGPRSGYPIPRSRWDARYPGRLAGTAPAA